MAIALNVRAYLTLAETKDFLKIKDSDTSKDDLVSRLINTAVARVEQYIDVPVLAKQFIEYFDGNNSNVLIPTHFPIQSISEIKIDFNRNFDNATAVDSSNYILRGIPALNQGLTGINDDQVIGLDVVLRDDSNAAIMGRIFAGSVIQSIKMTYTAGRAPDAASVPDDLKTATLMLVDYLYIIKENREYGVASKGVMGQSYSKKEVGVSGMPIEIEALINEYVDHAFGPVAVPQKNTFRI